MFKNAPVILMVISFCMNNLHAAAPDFSKLHNDKEVRITSFSQKDMKRVLAKYPEASVRLNIKDLFYQSGGQYLESENQKCEFRLIDNLIANLDSAKLPRDQKSLEEYYKLLRSTQSIDDVLYDVLVGITNDYFGLKALVIKPYKGQAPKTENALEKRYDLKELFGSFKKWPNESELCAYQEYVKLKNLVINKKGKPALGDLGTLNSRALKRGLISIESFEKIEYLRTKSGINKRNLWLQDYFKITFNAKNKMVPKNKPYVTRDMSKEDDYSTERIKRFSRLTRRKVLYNKYTETQIILLSQLLQKASRRMGVDPDTKSKAPVLSQEFSVLNSQGEYETLVEKIELDPQSQYTLARRLMRKDMTELQMMDIFQKTIIKYEDVVMAAFETGYISWEDLEFVVNYDDLWNPNITEFERVMGYVFNVAGYGTFFLPPPWNITAAIAIGIAQGVVDDKTKTGAEHDNPATFIE